MLKKVIWKDVSGYEKDYKVSNYGDVKYPVYGRSGNILYYVPVPVYYKNSIPRVTLRINGKREGIRVHRLVAEAFLKKPFSALYVRILGSKPTVDNVEWIKPKKRVKNKKYGLYIYIEDNIEKGLFTSLMAIARVSKFKLEKIEDIYNGTVKIKGVRIIKL